MSAKGCVLTHSTEEDGSIVPRENRFKPHRVASRHAHLLTTLLGHPLSHGHSTDSTRLRHDNVTVSTIACSYHTVQNKLGNLKMNEILS